MGCVLSGKTGTFPGDIDELFYLFGLGLVREFLFTNRVCGKKFRLSILKEIRLRGGEGGKGA